MCYRERDIFFSVLNKSWIGGHSTSLFDLDRKWLQYVGCHWCRKAFDG